jgi:oligopeptide transport system substrate-binding protein
VTPVRRPVRAARAASAILVAGLLLAGAGPAHAVRDDVRILSASPSTLDPAAQGDIGSAAVSAQLFESVTAIDRELRVQPALARSWEVRDGGSTVVFHLRDGLSFSDGSPLTAADVVASWLRLLDPQAPSPLSSLALGIRGARDRLAGRVGPDAVGIRADGSDVVVSLETPNSDFPAIVAGPSFGVVPETARRDPSRFDGAGVASSGGYVLAAVTDTELTLHANERYWAGRPAIGTVHLVLSIDGRSPVAAFEDGTLDYTSIAGTDASWIAYDPTLGPSLRRIDDLSVTYLGFDTTTAPFDDVRVRRAVAAAVDWRRVVTLAGHGLIPADGLIPPGIPGRPDGDFLPAYDPAGARRLLADAGYPGGAGFPAVAFAIGGLFFAPAIAADLERNLGIAVSLESLADHFDRLSTATPPMWILGWIADYPGPDDFLGVLLGTDVTSNYGRWSSSGFDAAIAEALGASDPAAAAAAYARAMAVVRDDVPVVPLAYAGGWALSREGLLGAHENGLGVIRLAGLAWGAGS